MPLLHAFLNGLRPAAGQSTGSPSPPALPLEPGAQPRGIDAGAPAEEPADASDSGVSPAGGLIGEVAPGPEQPAVEPAHFQVGHWRDRAEQACRDVYTAVAMTSVTRLAPRAYRHVCTSVQSAAQALLRHQPQLR